MDQCHLRLASGASHFRCGQGEGVPYGRLTGLARGGTRRARHAVKVFLNWYRKYQSPPSIQPPLKGPNARLAAGSCGYAPPRSLYGVLCSHSPRPPSGRDKCTCAHFTPHPRYNAERAAGSRNYGATLKRTGHEGGCRFRTTRPKSLRPLKLRTWVTAPGSQGQCRKRHPPPSPPHANPLVPGAPAPRTPQPPWPARCYGNTRTSQKPGSRPLLPLRCTSPPPDSTLQKSLRRRPMTQTGTE